MIIFYMKFIEYNSLFILEFRIKFRIKMRRGDILLRQLIVFFCGESFKYLPKRFSCDEDDNDFGDYEIGVRVIYYN